MKMELTSRLGCVSPEELDAGQPMDLDGQVKDPKLAIIEQSDAGVLEEERGRHF
jgi:hypothetical protein